MKPVEDVGIGVGYFCFSLFNLDGDTRAKRLLGRGKDGEDGNGSNAGSNEGAGRFTPATGGTGSGRLLPFGEESILADTKLKQEREQVAYGSECPRPLVKRYQT